ncbi:MAG TPA: hypothetical protein DHV36_18130 [Desulfobacteraceae bacterium]|nr:hypothetical protein [Desulfobacteraceae bacterium]
MKKLKILHTLSNDQWGGQERRVYNECRWMQAQGHQITIVTRKGCPLYQKAIDEGWQVFGISFNGISAPFTFFRLLSILKEVSPHVVNTHGNMDAKLALPAARQMKTPCVILSRHITPKVNNTWYNRLLYNRLCDLVFTTADCTTEQVTRDLGLPKHKAHTVSSGIVPPKNLLSRKEERSKLRESLGHPPETRYLGYVGRMDRDKGLSDILEAFFSLRDIFPRHKLVFVGSASEYGDELRMKADNLGLQDRVIFTGYQADPWPYYRAFDVKIIASRSNEGVAQSVLESMYCRCPVIATRIGGLPDVVHNEENGLLVPPCDPDALSLAIRNTLSNTVDTNRRVEAAYKYINASHTITAMGKRVLDLLQEKGL